jgi:DNA modification methylase
MPFRVGGVEARPSAPHPPRDPSAALDRLLVEGVTWGDAAQWLPAFPEQSVDLFFTSPPYADARAYSRIHPDRYVEWFLPLARAMFRATAAEGSFVLNIKNRVAKSGPLRGQRHPYVYELVLALQHLGWRWIETYIWTKPNAVPGRFGPRTKDAFEYVYHFARGRKPYFDLDAVRVPYKTPPNEILRRRLDTRGRRETAAGYGRNRAQTYEKGGADPGNVLAVPQTYNQHYGVDHTAAMPEGLAAFFAQATCPPGGVVIDPFCGSGTTQVVARRFDRRAGGLELHREFVDVARDRLRMNEADDSPGFLRVAV